MFCPNCGSKIADGASFCPNCGSPAAPAARKPAPSSGRSGQGAGAPPRRNTPRNVSSRSDTAPAAPRRAPAAPRPAAPERSSSYARPSSYDRSEPSRPYPPESDPHSHETRKFIILIILAVLILSGLLAGIAWYVGRDTDPDPVVLDDPGTASSEPQGQVQTSIPEPADEAATPAIEYLPSDDAEPAAASESRILMDNSWCTVTMTGLRPLNDAGCYLNLSFENKTSQPLAFGYCRPVVDGYDNATEGIFSIPALGSAEGSILLSLSRAGAFQEISEISLPVFVFDDPGNVYVIPSTQKTSGANYINETLEIRIGG